MTVSTRAEVLVDALSTVRKVIPRKSTLPIIEHALLSVTEGDAWLHATDMNTTVSVHVEDATSDMGEGAFTVPADRFYKTLRTLDGDEPVALHYTPADNAIVLKMDSGQFKGVSHDPEDFPEIPSGGDDEWYAVLDKSQRERLLNTALNFVSNDALRPAMMEVCIEPDIANDSITAIGTDGHRLCARLEPNIEMRNKDPQETSAGVGKTSLLVPADVVELGKQISGSATLRMNSSHTALVGEDVIVQGRRISETYPDYRAVLPSLEENNLVVSCDATELEQVLRRISLYTSQMTNRVRLTVAAPSGRIFLESNDIERAAEASESIDAEVYSYEEEDFLIGFNADYLRSAIAHTETNRVTLRFGSPTRASIVEPCEPGSEPASRTHYHDHTMIVMPVMLNTPQA